MQICAPHVRRGKTSRTKRDFHVLVGHLFIRMRSDAYSAKKHSCPLCLCISRDKKLFPRGREREKTSLLFREDPTVRRMTSRVTPVSSRQHVTRFTRDQRTLAMEATGRREPEVGVATQTPSACAVRSMHPEITYPRFAAGDKLDLIYHDPMANKVHPFLNDRRTMPRPERQTVSE